MVHKNRIRHFGQDHTEGKGELLVSLGGRLAVEDEAREVIFRLDLGEDEGGQDGDLEDDEDAVLERDAGVVEAEESEAGEEGEGDVVEETVKP